MHVDSVTFIVRRFRECACNSRRTETTGVFLWFADSDSAPHVTLAHQDLLCAAFVPSRTEGVVDHVSFEDVLLGVDIAAA